MDVEPTGQETRCADCDAVLALEHHLPERKPCPSCGSMSRKHFVELHSVVRVEGSVKANVERGLNDVRLAVLGILVGIALTVAFGVSGSAWVRIAAGLSSFVIASLLIRWGRSRHYMMEFMHRVTGG